MLALKLIVTNAGSAPHLLQVPAVAGPGAYFLFQF